MSLECWECEVDARVGCDCKKSGNPCLICGKLDRNKAICFKGTNHCCEDHRKILVGELPQNAK